MLIAKLGPLERRCGPQYYDCDGSLAVCTQVIRRVFKCNAARIMIEAHDTPIKNSVPIIFSYSKVNQRWYWHRTFWRNLFSLHGSYLYDAINRELNQHFPDKDRVKLWIKVEEYEN